MVTTAFLSVPLTEKYVCIEDDPKIPLEPNRSVISPVHVLDNIPHAIFESHLAE